MASAQNINVESWLKDKHLDTLIDEFKRRNITIEELCQFEEEDLRAFGIGFGLDTFDAARFAKYIVKHKQNCSAINIDNAISRAVVITTDEETLLQQLQNRRNQIKSLINRADSSNTEKINAQNEEIIEQKFTQLMEEMKQKKHAILKEIMEKQKEKQLLIEQHVMTLKEYLQNIEEITNNYNQLLIQNEMNRKQRKDKLSALVTEECGKLLPQIDDVQIVFNNRLATPFLAEICKIVNIGLFYPTLSAFGVKQIGSKCVSMQWNANLSKEELIYVEDDNINMDHIMMCLECKKVDDAYDDDEKENILNEDNMVHYIDYEVDKQQYDFTFHHLQTCSTYLATLKCISMHQTSLISKQQQTDLRMNKSKVMQQIFTTVKHESFIFQSELNKISITNDGKTATYQGTHGNNGQICCVLVGPPLNTELDDKNKEFKLSFTVDAKSDHIGFGFTSTDFATFEHSDWGMGGLCTFFFSDRDFRGAPPAFQNKNSQRLTVTQGNTVHIEVNCKALSGKIWVDGQTDSFCETSLPKQFCIGVVLGGRIGSSVTLVSCYDMLEL